MSIPKIIAVLSNCSSQILTKNLETAAGERNMDLCFKSFDNSRLLLSISSKDFAEFSPDTVIILLSSRVLMEEFLDKSTVQQVSFADDFFKELAAVWKMLDDKNISVFQSNLVEMPDCIWGDSSLKTKSSFLFQIRRLNSKLNEEIAHRSGVFAVDVLSYQLKFGYDYVFSSTYYYASMQPFRYEFIKALSGSILYQMECLSGKIKKCIVLDLDNVIWGGILSEDGIDGITKSGLGLGKAYYDFRLWLKDLKRRGVLLAICSKNDEASVKRLFEEADDMVLCFEDFAAVKINWNNKIENIRQIRNDLGIGFDAIVFLDDSKSERGSVKEIFPDITVPDMPEDPALFIDFLSNLRLFTGFASDDMAESRVLHYKYEKIREELFNSSFSREDYLTKLDMTARYKFITSEDVKRVSQLFLRSNRFNLRTVRFTEPELDKKLSDPKYFMYCVSLKDKYEDYGIVSAIIGERVSDSEVFILNWVISCRAFERTLEQFVMNRFVEVMSSENISLITAEYLRTDKNNMVKDIYSDLGFISKADNKYYLKPNSYTPNKTYIMEEQVF